ncbi:MAG: HEAT repeat domain-containing protein [Hyphomicrobiales bacterium]
MRKYVPAILLAATVFFSLPSQADDLITVEGELVNIEIATPVPVDEALQRLGAAMNVAVAGSAGPGNAGPLRLRRAGLMEALQKLAPGRSFVIERTGNPARVVRIVFSGRIAPGTVRLEAESAPAAAEESVSAELQDIARLSYTPGWVSSRQLEAIARRNKSTKIRIAALLALGQFARYGAIPILGQRLAADPDPRIRLAAAEALRIAGSDRALGLIRAAIASERDPGLRRRLAELAGN